jgi:proline racemase
MKFSRIITAVDSHTEGEPARVVIGGAVPFIPGKTMFEKRLWCIKNMDNFRTMLMYEPRGHSAMSGSIVMEPTSPQADIGVLFIEVSGWLPMCGHGTIATCTVLVETGIIEAKEPVTKFTLDTPAGLVKAEVEVKDGKAKKVTIKNIPSFLYKSDVEVDVPGISKLRLDIAYGGNFYAILNAKDVGLEVKPEHNNELIEAGRKIRVALNEQVKVVHPENSKIDFCSHVRFLGPTKLSKVGTRNAVIYGPGQIDRSPCGTGTSAEVAMNYAKGKLKLNQEFVSESIIGSHFVAKAVEETKVANLKAIVPAITGRAWVLGIQQFVLDPDDPFPNGFYLGPKDPKYGGI